MNQTTSTETITVSITPSTKQSRMKMRLIQFSLVVLVCLLLWLILTLLGENHLFKDINTKNDTLTTESTSIATTSPTIDPEPTAISTPRTLYLVSNCKLWQINSNGTLTQIKEDDVLCNSSPNIYATYPTYIKTYYVTYTDKNNLNTYEEHNNLIDLDTLAEIVLPPDTSFLGYDKNQKLIYSLNALWHSNIIKINRGPIGNLSQTTLLDYSFDGGRGTAIDEDVRISPNELGDKIIYQNSYYTGFFSTPNDTNFPIDKGGALILTKDGNRLLEVPLARQTKWLNDNSFITFIYDDEYNAILRKYSFNEDNTYKYNDLYTLQASLGSIYYSDILENKMLVSILQNDQYNTYFIDLEEDIATIQKLPTKTAENIFLDSNKIVGFEVSPCDETLPLGDHSLGLVCPGDNPFYHYKVGISIFDITTTTAKHLLDIDEPKLIGL